VLAGPTVPDVGHALVTTTVVKGSPGEVALHLRWKEGAVIAMHRNALVIEVPFLPDARRTGLLEGYHAFLGASPEIRMVSGGKGPIALHLGDRAFRRLSP
jgi:hypothetical protein